MHQISFVSKRLVNILTLFYPHIQREGNGREASIYEWEFICVDLGSIWIPLILLKTENLLLKTL